LNAHSRRRTIILLAACFVTLAAVLVWRSGFVLTVLLERHVLPAYPDKHASLRQILTHFKDELDRQGLKVQVQVLNENGLDDARVVRGIAGNGYLFLYGVSEAFETRIRWRGKRVTVSGVCSKREGEVGLGP